MLMAILPAKTMFMIRLLLAVLSLLLVYLYRLGKLDCLPTR